MSHNLHHPALPADGRKISTPSGEFFLVDRGQGQPVLLVHGFPLDHSMWNAQIDRLSRDYRVLAPDLRGFGRSGVTPGTVSMATMADDLAKMLDALQITESVVLCGLSMGGYVAFQFWRKYSDRLRALLLCDTRAVADTPEAAAGRLATAERAVKEGSAVVGEAMLPKLFAEATFKNNPAVIEQTRHVMAASPPEGVAAALRGMASRPSVQADLPRIALPTLVIVGEHDAISSPEEMRAIAAGIPGAEFQIIAGAGHMSPCEAPAEFNAALEDFLTRRLKK
jgi:3-oxoadipate enol-lactonase